ncbi:MAG: glycosyltransferase family 2 protein [Thermoproteota archaeon]
MVEEATKESALHSIQLSIIIPTYMEAENLPKLIERIEEALKEIDFEIIIVDDNSPDGTADIAEGLGIEFGNIRVIRRPGKLGLGSAVMDGLKLARAQLIAVMDADLQHPPEILPRILEELRKGCDFVIASRYVKGGGAMGLSLWRRFVSRGATILAHVSLPKTRHVSDPLSGYFAFNKKVIYGIKLNPVGYKILLEMLVKGGYGRVCEIPYSFQRRVGGKSKLGLSEILLYLKHLYSLARETREYRRLISFVLVGLTGILVDESILWFLTEHLYLHYMFSATISAEASILSNFALNETFTFRDLVTDSSLKSVIKRVFEYNWTRIIGICLGLITLYVLTVFLGLHYLLANLAGIAVGLVWNYSTSISIVWKS